MTEPYRDRHLTCPACKAALREFKTRQVCDACDGMMVTQADLAAAIHDLTSITPTFEFTDGKLGARRCPHCAAPMTQCKVRVVVDDEVEKTRPELDLCGEHGIWFDADELAKVFEKVAGKGFGGGAGRKSGAGHAVGERSQGGWSAMFKGRSGGWGGW
jgi:Zn-finger nucleic acid-binding protein